MTFEEFRGGLFQANRNYVHNEDLLVLYRPMPTGSPSTRRIQDYGPPP
jgi:hypothetical protein